MEKKYSLQEIKDAFWKTFGEDRDNNSSIHLETQENTDYWWKLFMGNLEEITRIINSATEVLELMNNGYKLSYKPNVWGTGGDYILHKEAYRSMKVYGGTIRELEETKQLKTKELFDIQMPNEYILME